MKEGKFHFNAGRGSTPCGLYDPKCLRYSLNSDAAYLLQLAEKHPTWVCGRCMPAIRKAADMKTPAPRQETPGPQSKE